MEIKDNLLYTKTHEWIRIETDNTATVGITEYAQSELGDIVYIDIPDATASLKENESLGSIESVKTVSEIALPFAATITGCNEGLADSPETVNQSPYDAGWLIKISFNEKIQDKLLTPVEYKKIIG